MGLEETGKKGVHEILEAIFVRNDDIARHFSVADHGIVGQLGELQKSG
jgi:hypothetical protein